MALWIESHVELGGHKKMYQLCKELNIEPPTAIGHLHYLWWWAIQNRVEDGDLSSLPLMDIARVSKWDGNPKEFITALKKCGFLKKDLKITDWTDYAGHLLKSRERKKRWEENNNKTFQERSNNSLTKPNQTKPYRTVNTKTGLLSDSDKQIVLQDIGKAMDISPNSEAASVRLKEICFDIGKIKGVDNVLALARHKALKQSVVV